jgi:uncharacterized protein DUF4160
MPTVLRWRGFRFYFFSNEGHEPPHLHVDKDDMTAKFWLDPVSLASHSGFSESDVRMLAAIIKEHHEEFLQAWHDYFG